MGRTVEEKAMIEALPPDERIKKEAEKLLKLYTRAHKKRRQLAVKLIANAAFMSVKLDDLQREIAAEGMTETYKNGANQSGIKKSAKVEVYNTTMKSYMAAIKQLNDMLDDGEAGGNEFTAF
nr:MAG TPA: hypothetical protein [Caudoviricetes sp.]